MTVYYGIIEWPTWLCEDSDLIIGHSEDEVRATINRLIRAQDLNSEDFEGSIAVYPEGHQNIYDLRSAHAVTTEEMMQANGSEDWDEITVPVGWDKIEPRA